jgi:hypothetical protein
MIVAYYFTHNDGEARGILDAPGQESGLELVDLYEADGTIRTFATREEAEAWLKEQDDDDPYDEDELEGEDDGDE